MIRLRALLMGAALITGVSALASAQPPPQYHVNYGARDKDRDRGRDHDRDGRANRYYYNGDRDDRGYYQRYYSRGYEGGWRDRGDRGYRDRDDRNYRNRRDRDHDGDRR